MKLHFFRIPVHDSEKKEAELNRFFANNKIVAVDKNFCSCGINSFWSICVTALTVPVNGSAQNVIKNEKVDYRKI